MKGAHNASISVTLPVSS